MSGPEFDELIHAPHRLRICALLVSVDSAEFGMVRDHLGVADSVLSKHLKVLADAGYVKLAKPTGVGGKVRTWVSLTRAGRTAFEGHLEALRGMVEAARAVQPEATSTP